MKRLVVISYNRSEQFNDPYLWFERIDAAEKVIEALTEYCEVYDIHQINYTGKLTENGVNHIFISKPFSKLFPVSLHKKVKQLKPDIVLIHGLHYALQVIQLRMVTGNQTIIMAQHHAENPVTGVRKIIFRIADRVTNGYFFATRSMAERWLDMKLIRHAKKIFAVPEASSVFAGTGNIAADPNSFLWVGRLDANKDPLTVINAFSEYARQNPSARLYMIYQADQMLKEVAEAVNNTGASDNIILIGKVERMEMIDWYQSCAYIICSSYYEGCNVSVIEGMSCGCIPIVTRIPSFDLHTDNGRIGFQFTPGNIKELIQCLNSTAEKNLENERREVLQYFDEHLSFRAIGKKIYSATSSLTE